VKNAGHVHNKNAKQACLLFTSCMLLVREVVTMRSQNTNLMLLCTIQVPDRNRESSCYRTLYFSTNTLREPTNHNQLAVWPVNLISIMYLSIFV